jgi:hypothetical protein
MWHVRGEVGLHTAFWWENLREKRHFEDPSLDEKIILKWIFRKWNEGHGLDYHDTELEQMAGSCECGNEYLSFFLMQGIS